MNITRGQWLFAAFAAAAVHLGLLGLFLLGDATPRQTDQAPRGVMVSLDSLDPGLPPQSAVESTPDEAVEPDLQAASAPEATTSSAPTAPLNSAAQIPEAATDIGPEPATSNSQDIAPASSPANADSAPAQTPQTATPRVADAVTIRPQNVTESLSPQEQVTARAADPSDFAGNASTPESANGAYGSAEEATDDYIVRLRAWLSRHKQYPMAARNQEIEGTVRLYLVIDDNGNILSQRIVESSGSPMLDEAARQMLERSQPLPRMPMSMRRNRLELVVPVVFSLS